VVGASQTTATNSDAADDRPVPPEVSRNVRCSCRCTGTGDQLGRGHWPGGSCDHRRELPSELNDLLQVVPLRPTHELALVLPVKHPLSRLSELHKDDLYRLGSVLP